MLTVLTANLKNPFFSQWRVDREAALARLERFARLAEAAAADVLLLQEVGRGRVLRVDAWLSDRLGMAGQYVRANGSAARWGREEGLAILSRYPLRAPVSTLLAGGLWRRPALGAVVELPTGDEIAVYATHLSLRPWRNRRQPARLWGWVAATAGGRAAVVGGDFNTGEDAPHLRPPVGWVDLFRAAHPSGGGETYERRLGAWRWARRLDYLFLRPGDAEMRLVGCDAVTSTPPFSDHLAVVARVDV